MCVCLLQLSRQRSAFFTVVMLAELACTLHALLQQQVPVRWRIQSVTDPRIQCPPSWEMSKQERDAECVQLEQQLASWQQQADDERAAMAQQIEGLQGQADAERAQLEQQLASLQQQADDERAAMAQQIEGLQGQADAERAQLEQQLASLQQQADDERAAMAQQLVSLQQQADERMQLEQQIEGLQVGVAALIRLPPLPTCLHSQRSGAPMNHGAGVRRLQHVQWEATYCSLRRRV